MKIAITELLQKIKDKAVLVIGDVMVDAYYSGRVERISPEAPVPIVLVNEKDDRLGGAANVALNLKALGAQPFICAVVGNDTKGEIFKNLLETRGISGEGIVSLDNRPTTVKTRIISDSQQMIRVDEEVTNYVSTAEEDVIIDRIKKIIETHRIEAVIFEDYNKGLLTPRIIAESISYCNERGILTTVDPKKDNFLSFKNCTLFKPNLKEVREGLKQELEIITEDTLSAVGMELRSKLDHKLTLVTLSELGVFYENANHAEIIPAHKRDIADVSGAGDTVIAAVTVFLLAGASLRDAAQLANLAGGLVCESVGVVPIDKEKLVQEGLKL